jgi:hypothetical protein
MNPLFDYSLLNVKHSEIRITMYFQTFGERQKIHTRSYYCTAWRHIRLKNVTAVG